MRVDVAICFSEQTRRIPCFPSVTMTLLFLHAVRLDQFTKRNVPQQQFLDSAFLFEILNCRKFGFSQRQTWTFLQSPSLAAVNGSNHGTICRRLLRRCETISWHFWFTRKRTNHKLSFQNYGSFLLIPSVEVFDFQLYGIFLAAAGTSLSKQHSERNWVAALEAGLNAVCKWG